MLIENQISSAEIYFQLHESSETAQTQIHKLYRVSSKIEPRDEKNAQ